MKQLQFSCWGLVFVVKVRGWTGVVGKAVLREMPRMRVRQQVSERLQTVCGNLSCSFLGAFVFGPSPYQSSQFAKGLILYK